jgi:uncharacterized protein YqcC (DUF446 family)
MATAHQRLAALADDLEQAMRAASAWTEPPPPLRPFQMPFAMDAMPFEHWLQLVLVPRMRELATTRGPLPMRSNLAPHAVREWDGRDDVGPLVDVLRELDALCPAPGPGARLGEGRRLAAGVALILLLTGWAVVALQVATYVAAWLAPYGAEPGPAERAAHEALAIVDAAVKAATREALHAAAPTDEALVEVMPMTPGWVAPVLMVAVFFLGAIPITWSLLRWAGRF